MQEIFRLTIEFEVDVQADNEEAAAFFAEEAVANKIPENFHVLVRQWKRLPNTERPSKLPPHFVRLEEV